MLWPHTKVPTSRNCLQQTKRPTIIFKLTTSSAQDEFFDLTLPPSFKSLILAVQLPGIYSLEYQYPQMH